MWFNHTINLILTIMKNVFSLGYLATGVTVLATLLMVYLKLDGALKSLSWWWVFSPVLIPFACAVGLLMLCYLLFVTVLGGEDLSGSNDAQ